MRGAGLLLFLTTGQRLMCKQSSRARLSVFSLPRDGRPRCVPCHLIVLSTSQNPVFAYPLVNSSLLKTAWPEEVRSPP